MEPHHGSRAPSAALIIGLFGTAAVGVALLGWLMTPLDPLVTALLVVGIGAALGLGLLLRD